MSLLRKAGLFTAFLWLAACGRKQEMQGDILPPEKMEALLWDLMRADKYNQDYRFIVDTTLNRKETSIALYAEILDLHKVSQEQFRESFLYYRARPLELRALMDSIGRREIFKIDTTLSPVAVDTVAPVRVLPGPDDLQSY